MVVIMGTILANLTMLLFEVADLNQANVILGARFTEDSFWALFSGLLLIVIGSTDFPEWLQTHLKGDKQA
jgi:hypothetical protein